MMFVFAAGPPEVNCQVAADARAHGLWVNSASEPAQGNMAVPAIWRDGPFQLAVSTTGASPSLAARARDHAAGALGPAYGALAAVLAELRPEVLGHIRDPLIRARVFRGWSDAAWLRRIEHEGPDAVRSALRAELEQTPQSGHAL
jgi:precorrin-2 dehydrogenase/sirohydrochlorin ferrochelatase